jgi:hypothetical protein
MMYVAAQSEICGEKKKNLKTSGIRELRNYKKKKENSRFFSLSPRTLLN